MKKKKMKALEGLATAMDRLWKGATGLVSGKKSNLEEPLYKNLFDRGMVHRIDIEINEADWQHLRDHSREKIKYDVSVTIDGEKLNHVAMSTKGNASLSHVANSESDRYNFKLNFGRFFNHRTYHGLDKMKLSNLYHDRCGLKDCMSYRIMSEAGGLAPLTGFAWVKINGEDFGLYLTVEEVSKSWIARTQVHKGALYKPDPEWINTNSHVPGLKLIPSDLLNFFRKKREHFGSTDQGSDLVYRGDQVENYKGIFNNAITKISRKDQERLIQSLKKLNNRENLSSVLNIDEVIGYFAGHNFSMNHDSYTGITAHNYYLYEENGRLSAIAWDYNDGFGEFIAFTHPDLTMTDLVNWGIDTPLVDTEVPQRPLWAWIAEDEKYLNSYHAVLDDLIENYFTSGRFEEEATAIYSMIRPYLEKDPTFFYSMEECEKSYHSLKAFGIKRAKSIRKQLDGKLSTETDKQNEKDKVDASDITVLI